MLITRQVKLSVLSCIVGGSLAATFAGCGRDDVRTYRVPKETTPQLAAADLPSGHADVSGASHASAAPAIAAKVPADWQEAPLGQMRVASYRGHEKDGKIADISRAPLP